MKDERYVCEKDGSRSEHTRKLNIVSQTKTYNNLKTGFVFIEIKKFKNYDETLTETAEVSIKAFQISLENLPLDNESIFYELLLKLQNIFFIMLVYLLTFFRTLKSLRTTLPPKNN